MSRAERYAEGFHEGRRMAEDDIRNHPDQRTHWERELRADQGAYTSGGRAEALGRIRGYRDTWARWDAGTLTWEMFDSAPLGT